MIGNKFSEWKWTFRRSWLVWRLSFDGIYRWALNRKTKSIWFPKKALHKNYHLLKKEKGESPGEGWGEKHSAVPINILKMGFYFLIVTHADVGKGSKNHQGIWFHETVYIIQPSCEQEHGQNIKKKKNAVINKLQGCTCIQSASTFILQPWACKGLSYNIKDQGICP